MADSEQQFQELMAHLVVRANKMLSEQGRVLPLGLVLRSQGKVDVSLGVAETAQDIEGMTKGLRQSLAGLVAVGGIEATCIAFPKPDGSAVIALLENSENDCATVAIPVIAEPAPMLDTDGIQIDDGYVHVFPVVE